MAVKLHFISNNVKEGSKILLKGLKYFHISKTI